VTTVAAFHAHPDDEVLLTGGTLAKLAADGHRVVIVVATDGCMGEASDGRLAELRASARILGAARVVHLGYADSSCGSSGRREPRPAPPRTGWTCAGTPRRSRPPWPRTARSTRAADAPLG
jgi:LmbE family N-acetylglucosaminyl deacetylase